MNRLVEMEIFLTSTVFYGREIRYQRRKWDIDQERTSPVDRRAIERRKLPVDRRAVAILPVGRRIVVPDAQWFAETASVNRMEQQLHTVIPGRRRGAVRPEKGLPVVRRAIGIGLAGESPCRCNSAGGTPCRDLRHSVVR